MFRAAEQRRDYRVRLAYGSPILRSLAVLGSRAVGYANVRLICRKALGKAIGRKMSRRLAGALRQQPAVMLLGNVAARIVAKEPVGCHGTVATG